MSFLVDTSYYAWLLCHRCTKSFDYRTEVVAQAVNLCVYVTVFEYR